MSRGLRVIGRFAVRRRVPLVAAWLVAAAALVVGLVVVGPATADDLRVPGSDSAAAADVLADRLPPSQHGASAVVFTPLTGKVTDPANAAAVREALEAVRTVPHVVSAPDPFGDPRAGLVSADGRTAYTPVLLDVAGADLTPDVASSVVDALAPAEEAAVPVAVGGPVGEALTPDLDWRVPALAAAVAFVVLAAALGAVAAVLVLLAGALAAAVAYAAAGLLAHVVPLATLGPFVAAGAAACVGVAGGVLLLLRSRAATRASVPVPAAVTGAVATSGAVVVLGGGAMLLGAAALTLVAAPLVSSLAWAVALGVLSAVLATTTVMPALLALAGSDVDTLHVGGRRRRLPGEGPGRRWGHGIVRGRWAAALLGFAALVALAVPGAGLRLGGPDVVGEPEGTPARTAYDRLAAAGLPGAYGPFSAATTLSPPARPGSEYVAQTALSRELATSLPAARAQLQQKQAANTAAQRTTAQQRAATATQTSDVAAQRTATASEVTRLREEQVSLEAQRTSLEQQQASLESQADALAAQAGPLVSQAASASDAAATAASESERFALQAAEDEQDRAAAAAEVSRLSTRLDGLDAQRTTYSARIATLSARIARTTDPAARARLVAERNRVNTRLTQVESAITTTASDLQQEQAALTTAAADAASASAQASAQSQLASSLQGQADALQSSADSLDGSAASLRSQAEARGDELTSVVDQLETASASLVTAQERATTLQERATQLSSRGAALARQGAVLDTRARQLAQEATALQQRDAQAAALRTQLAETLAGVAGDPRATDERLVAVRSALAGTAGILRATAATIDATGTAALSTAIPTTRPASPATTDVLATLRDRSLPPVESTRTGVAVGGTTAEQVDLAAAIAARLPWVVLALLSLLTVVLVLVSRALLAPVLAALVTALAAAAGTGAMALVLPGRLGLRIGDSTPYPDSPVEAVPALLAPVVLVTLSLIGSTVLLAAVRRGVDEGLDVREAVRTGLGRVAGRASGALVGVVAVAAGSVLANDPTVRQLGLAAAVAGLLALVLVVVLLPALLAVVGRRALSTPGFLRRLPDLQLDGPPQRPAPLVPELVGGWGRPALPSGGGAAAVPAEVPDEVPDDFREDFPDEVRSPLRDDVRSGA